MNDFLRIYRCKGCGKRYARLAEHIAFCRAKHKDCCHCEDVRVRDKTMKAVQQIIQENRYGE